MSLDLNIIYLSSTMAALDFRLMPDELVPFERDGMNDHVVVARVAEQLGLHPKHLKIEDGLLIFHVTYQDHGRRLYEEGFRARYAMRVFLMIAQKPVLPKDGGHYLPPHLRRRIGSFLVRNFNERWFGRYVASIITGFMSSGFSPQQLLRH